MGGGKNRGKVTNILDEIGEDAVMYLVNTVVFDAEWMWAYKEYEVNEGSFTNAGGEKEKFFICVRRKAHILKMRMRLVL